MYFYIDNIYNRLYFAALDVALVASAFYVVYHLIMPAYIHDRKLWKLIGLSGGLLILLSGIYAGLMGLFLRMVLVPISFDFSWNYSDLQYNRLFIALLGVLAGGFIKLSMDRIAMSRRLETMEKEKSTAELTYLKSQLNPHFLFNSLNSLHAQLELNTGNAQQTLQAISGLLRYQLYECSADFIPLEREIAHLLNFFKLQQMRLDNCNAQISISGEPAELLIAPMLCMAFLENAFKHLDCCREQQSLIGVQVVVEDGKLLFSCSNTVGEPVETTGQDSHGIGLENASKRLELIYQGRYSLTKKVTNGIYKVNLEIML
jgi:sensor histidine kinase YesM